MQIHPGVATHEKPVQFVKQREHFQLPSVASLCDLSPKYSLLEITFSFRNAQSVPIVVSKPLYKGLVSHGWLTGHRAISHGRGGGI